MTAQCDAALSYAAAGALVLPIHTPVDGRCSCLNRGCESIGKHPRCLQGKDDATSDTATVERWWSMWPSASVAVRPAPGVVIIDVDPRNGGGTTLLNLERRNERLPRTQTVATGGGGLHIWLALHGAVKGKLGPGLDVKTNSGYVLMPPSVHLSGREYSWVNSTQGITPAPAWLVELLTPGMLPLSYSPTSDSPARAEALARVVREAEEGERNRRLFWAASRALEAGIDTAPLMEAAKAIGLPEHEVIRTVRSAARRVA